MANIMRDGFMVACLGVVSYLAASYAGPVFETPETYYVQRESNIRAQPSADGAVVLEFGAKRSDSFLGVEVPSRTDKTKKWLRISEGAFKGNYIWMEGLTRSPVPPCQKTTRKSVTVAPNQLGLTPAALANLPPPSGAAMTYTVSCRIDDNVLEVLTLEGGGVRYVRKRRS
jgi:hypothetical protein